MLVIFIQDVSTAFFLEKKKFDSLCFYIDILHII